MVYLLHAERPLCHAQHYLGYADNVDARLADHESGRGAHLTAAFRREGIAWQLVRTWEGDRKTERALKNRKDARSLCPLCQVERRRRQLENWRRRRGGLK